MRFGQFVTLSVFCRVVSLITLLFFGGCAVEDAPRLPTCEEAGCPPVLLCNRDGSSCVCTIDDETIECTLNDEDG